MHVRPYAPADREQCLGLFDGNTPRFFGAGERHSFAAFLDHPVGSFLVLCDDEGTVVGCGGIAVRNDGNAYLVWGMIDAGRQGRGYGRALALERLRAVARIPEVRRLALDTSQEAVGFYEKLGFRMTKMTPDHYAPGLHRYELELDVDEAFRRRMKRVT